MTSLPVFHHRCVSCHQPGHDLCRTCRFSLAATRAVFDPNGIAAAMPFDGTARSSLLALKYRNRRSVARHLARLMVRRLGLAHVPVDVVTWAPTSRARLAHRGFDQAELLARAVARELGLPCRRLLYRTHGAPQTGRSRAERLDGPQFRSRRAARPLQVLLIDDVVTTGATLLAAQQALLEAGVAEVHLVAAAATPAQPRFSPTRARTVATAGSGSSSTSTPTIPTRVAASTLVATSSRNAVRSAAAPSLPRAS
jgi:ComF family protein